MAPHAIISYDDTQNDHDALALGRVLASAGIELTLAYVRHTTNTRSDREELEGHEAEALLERGALALGAHDVERRVVVSGSTGEGLGRLAEQEHADIIVFGSDYRTASGHVSPGRSAQTLLEGGPAAVAVAPANYGSEDARRISTIGILPGSDDVEVALESANQLAARFDATVVPGVRNVDLLIVGSRAEARPGRVMITSSARNAIDGASAPVLVLARGVSLRFQTLVTV